jgi:hypothetical protein
MGRGTAGLGSLRYLGSLSYDSPRRMSACQPRTLPRRAAGLVSRYGRYPFMISFPTPLICPEWATIKATIPALHDPQTRRRPARAKPNFVQWRKVYWNAARKLISCKINPMAIGTRPRSSQSKQRAKVRDSIVKARHEVRGRQRRETGLWVTQRCDRDGSPGNSLIRHAMRSLVPAVSTRVPGLSLRESGRGRAGQMVTSCRRAGARLPSAPRDRACSAPCGPP